ncbi:Dual specificity protein kinase lkh1 [Smittium culicis]|uniref:Dual specificity protein kinase lkh1 n=1 Tax=Smittium culicis TaxID=133412 RepID=A0A1R1YQB9_9FUNG|nr:Dual specificity protein kinase lkh1 [Smittium culicis]
MIKENSSHISLRRKRTSLDLNEQPPSITSSKPDNDLNLKNTEKVPNTQENITPNSKAIINISNPNSLKKKPLSVPYKIKTRSRTLNNEKNSNITKPSPRYLTRSKANSLNRKDSQPIKAFSKNTLNEKTVSQDVENSHNSPIEKEKSQIIKNLSNPLNKDEKIQKIKIPSSPPNENESQSNKSPVSLASNSSSSNKPSYRKKISIITSSPYKTKSSPPILKIKIGKLGNRIIPRKNSNSKNTLPDNLHFSNDASIHSPSTRNAFDSTNTIDPSTLKDSYLKTSSSAYKPEYLNDSTVSYNPDNSSLSNKRIRLVSNQKNADSNKISKQFNPIDSEKNPSNPSIQSSSSTQYNRDPNFKYFVSNTENYNNYNSLDLKLNSASDKTEGHFIAHFNQLIASRYEVKGLLGQGTFGKVLKCVDKTTNKLVAVKVIKSVYKYRVAASMEIRVLETMKQHDPSNFFKCAVIRDSFDFNNHICMVFDLLSSSLYDFLKGNLFQPFPLINIQQIAYQIIRSVSFIHKLKLVHTDLKPENVLLLDDSSVIKPITKNTQSKILKSANTQVIDFGSAVFNYEHHPKVVSTRHYRAPEIILELGWSYPCDMWSIGCILVELLTGEALFQTHENLEHLAMIEKFIESSVPFYMLNKMDPILRSEFYSSNSNSLLYPTSSTSRISVNRLKKFKSISELISNGSDLPLKSLVDLIQQLLQFDPSLRISADRALLHDFFSIEIPENSIYLESTLKKYQINIRTPVLFNNVPEPKKAPRLRIIPANDTIKDFSHRDKTDFQNIQYSNNFSTPRSPQNKNFASTRDSITQPNSNLNFFGGPPSIPYKDKECDYYAQTLNPKENLGSLNSSSFLCPSSQRSNIIATQSRMDSNASNPRSSFSNIFNQKANLSLSNKPINSSRICSNSSQYKSDESNMGSTRQRLLDIFKEKSIGQSSTSNIDFANSQSENNSNSSSYNPINIQTHSSLGLKKTINSLCQANKTLAFCGRNRPQSNLTGNNPEYTRNYDLSLKSSGSNNQSDIKSFDNTNLTSAPLINVEPSHFLRTERKDSRPILRDYADSQKGCNFPSYRTLDFDGRIIGKRPRDQDYPTSDLDAYKMRTISNGSKFSSQSNPVIEDVHLPPINIVRHDKFSLKPFHLSRDENINSSRVAKLSEMDRDLNLIMSNESLHRDTVKRELNYNNPMFYNRNILESSIALNEKSFKENHNRQSLDKYFQTRNLANYGRKVNAKESLDRRYMTNRYEDSISRVKSDASNFYNEDKSPIGNNPQRFTGRNYSYENGGYGLQLNGSYRKSIRSVSDRNGLEQRIYERANNILYSRHRGYFAENPTNVPGLPTSSQQGSSTPVNQVKRPQPNYSVGSVKLDEYSDFRPNRPFDERFFESESNVTGERGRFFNASNTRDNIVFDNRENRIRMNFPEPENYVNRLKSSNLDGLVAKAPSFNNDEMQNFTSEKYLPSYDKPAETVENEPTSKSNLSNKDDIPSAAPPRSSLFYLVNNSAFTQS